jgi:hypothetical protein
LSHPVPLRFFSGFQMLLLSCPRMKKVETPSWFIIRILFRSSLLSLSAKIKCSLLCWCSTCLFVLSLCLKLVSWSRLFLARTPMLEGQLWVPWCRWRRIRQRRKDQRLTWYLFFVFLSVIVWRRPWIYFSLIPSLRPYLLSFVFLNFKL